MNNNKRFLNKEIGWLLQEKYKNKKTLLFYWDLMRLKRGVPLAYLIGNIPFLGCNIDLSQKPLIPRTETEFWTERAIQEIRAKHTGEHGLCILDLFAGSGCIGIALLKHITSATVDFGEKEQGLLKQIKTNVLLNNIDTNRVALFQTNYFNSIPKKEYDYIFANPPYIAHGKKQSLQRTVTSFEPHEALFADDDGLFYIKKLLQGPTEYLKKGGVLFIEFDTPQKETIEKLIPRDKYTYTFWKDQFENQRVLKLTKK